VIYTSVRHKRTLVSCVLTKKLAKYLLNMYNTIVVYTMNIEKRLRLATANPSG